MDDMMKFITFIKELVDDEFYQALEPVKAEDYFWGKGCYEFAKILKAFLPGSKVMITKDYHHCGIFYKGNVYDAKGICKKEDFQDLTEEDQLKLDDPWCYGISEVKFEGKEVATAVQEEIKQCRIDSLLERVANLEEEKPKSYVLT